jgi:transcriptional regulator with XRE-family HTH domain
MTDAGTLIRQVRIAKDMSQQELATKAGLGEATVRRAEVGRGTPSTQTLSALANALGVRLSWLIDPQDRDRVPDAGRRRISRRPPPDRPRPK